ncbi:MAG: isopentenyl-diphosphate Delta-isomerase [Pirellulaceae bacterium]|nr:MAG: isopentenyl-diphosphate Delta-isomerase [Pirellulaceae bacterium]
MNDSTPDQGELILVDAHDNPIGRADKVAAHRNGGRLHRAFSVFIFDALDRLLLQRRASSKYHFGGLWSNTCCGHPTGDLPTKVCAERRLLEEFGFTTALTWVCVMEYQAHDPASGLTEREMDHVFVGRYAGAVRPDPREIDAFRWSSWEEVRREIADRPARFTPWFRLLVQQHGGEIVAAVSEL